MKIHCSRDFGVFHVVNDQGSFKEGRQPLHEVFAGQAKDDPTSADFWRQGKIERLTAWLATGKDRQYELLRGRSGVLFRSLRNRPGREHGTIKIAA